MLALLTGCVGTSLKVDQSYVYNASDSFSYSIIDEAEVTPQGMSIFKDRLKAQLIESTLYSEDSNKEIEVTINNYRMRHGAARALAGIMAGADNITSTIRIKDKSSGDVVGEFQVVSKNPTATGTAKGLIEQHADKIVVYVKSGK